MNIITEKLLNACDKNYKKFSEKLIPDTKYEIIGVRVPVLKKIAKELSLSHNRNLLNNFMSSNHYFYEEYFLHGILLSYLKTDNIDKFIEQIESFIPHIDNWATCDSTVMNLKIIQKYPVYFLTHVEKWLKNDNIYIKRFAIVILLSYYLDKNFNSAIINMVAKIKSDNYYVNMACAWFFSVALIKQYNYTIPLLKKNILSNFTHNKTIQKAVESYRISNETKIYLKTLKRKKDKD